MPKHKRILTLAIALMAAVGVLAVLLTVLWLQQAVAAVEVDFSDWAARRALSLSLRDHFTQSVRTAIGASLVVIIGGAVLLWRTMRPFALRLERSEAQTQAIIQHAAESILTVDASGAIASFNPPCEELFGYAADDVVGAHARLLLPGLDLTWSQRPGDQPDAHGEEAAQRIETQGRRRDGSPIPLEISLRAFRTTSFTGAVLVMRDVTQRHRIDEEHGRTVRDLRAHNARLAEEGHQLERINRQLEDLTYLASHDLKEPLRGIAAYCGILLEDYGQQLDATGCERLEAMRRLCQRLEQLIHDLLAYARAGTHDPVLQRVGWQEVVDDVLETLAPLIEKRRAVVEVAGPLPEVNGEATLLHEVVHNLLSNALKFNDQPVPRIEIGIANDDPGTIYVSDNGIGIAPEHHDTVFEMFRRLQARSQYEGSGAGLSIVRRIVEAHGGRIWVDSAPGEGATFFVALPSPDGAMPRTRRPSAAHREPAAEPRPSGPHGAFEHTPA